MTNEEAKNFLMVISYKLGSMAVEYLTEKDGEKMREAIETLYQEPCEDAVSRQAVCNIVDAIRDCISVEGYWAILERLKKLPSVKPTQNIQIQITEREKYGRFN